jgi:hypothetical protein
MPIDRISASSSSRHSTVAAQAGLDGTSVATMARTRSSWRVRWPRSSPDMGWEDPRRAGPIVVATARVVYGPDGPDSSSPY